MGQQQLLLLVLSIVLVGLAVVVGIQAVAEGKDRARQDLRINKITEVATRIQVWSRTSAALGGGTMTDGTIDWPRFRLETVGLAGTQINGVNWMWSSQGDGMGCFLIFVNPSPTDNEMGTRVHLHLLNDACVAESWRQNPALILSGQDLSSIRWVSPPY